MSEGGFPQLDASTYPSQVFWLTVSFALLYALMSRLALPRVGKALDLRRSLNEGNLAKAEEWNEEAEKIKSDFEKSLAKAQRAAAATLAAAERDLSAKIAAEQAAFAENARKRLATAEQNIVKAKADALHSLADIAAEIAGDMAEKIGGVPVNKADAKKAVTAAMQEA